MQKNRLVPEILAPAGSPEQLTAAVRSGADAVYFGASSFNARRNAENFTDDDFIGAVRYCHERGVKAYITLNTVIKDEETKEFEKTLSLIAKSGADAVIVQDMGVVSFVKKYCPELSLHASTQMAVHNLSGAKYLENLGFSRVVLARELSFSEIKEICENINIETEVFVHGAHCMSASGMCYMSSVLGTRSGNRGLCAQPCRLNFKSKGREYSLSLKDMCLAEKTEKLIEAGVASFKIEGRMKRPEYTSSAVKTYKEAINGNIPDVKLLQNVFSRSGFTSGYFDGQRNLSMFGYRTKEDVVSAEKVLPGIANEYRNENPLVEISMHFTVKENENCILTVTDGKNTVSLKGVIPEKALKTPLSSESAEKSLGKLGSTFYFCNNITCEIEDGLMLRASDINALRRDACEELSKIRGERKEYAFSQFEQNAIGASFAEEPEMRFMFKSVSQVPENAKGGKIILPLKEILSFPEIINRHGKNICAEIPALFYNESEIKKDLQKLRELGVKYAYCDNIGAVALAKKLGFFVLGGALLNVMNSTSCEMYYELGISDMTLSQESSFNSVKNIRTRAKTGILIYGYLPLMHFRCCPAQTENGCVGCTGKNTLIDRMGEKFTLLCENKKFSVLYNTVPLYVADKKLPEVSFVTLKFTFEDKFECAKIIELCKNKQSLSGRKKTAGLYERELL